MAVPDAVIVQQSEWWNVLEALGPLATLLAAAVAGFIAWQALKERSLADRRSEWWSRAQWALDASLSADMERKATGLGVLALLAKSHWPPMKRSKSWPRQPSGRCRKQRCQKHCRSGMAKTIASKPTPPGCG